MLQYIKQIVYCNNNSTKNSPRNLVDTQLTSGTIFSNYLPISQLGVQAPPGTKFYINGNDNPVIVGFTGLFEVDLTSGGTITTLTFDENSIKRIKENDSNILIVDMAYLGGVTT